MSFDPAEVAMAASMAAAMNGGGSEVEQKWELILDTEGKPVPFSVTDGVGEHFIKNSTESTLGNISSGDSCKVVFDGVEYVDVAVGRSSNGGLYVGDEASDIEAIPYCFIINPVGDGVWDVWVYADNEETSHTFALYAQKGGSQPNSGGGSSGGGGGLTVVEIGEVMDTENYQLTESEIAAFNAAAESDMPIIVKFGFNGAKTAAVFFCMKQDDVMTTYMGSVQNWEIIIMCMLGQWQVMVQERPLPTP